ncbi:transcriptional regulator [Streptomyces tricolor]|nr:transcriptional regulator [Streptomyces tricolor]
MATATIKKYYLREAGAPGRQIDQHDGGGCDEEHLRRLRLVRAMIQVGRVPVATVPGGPSGTSTAANSLGLTVRLGAALWALPQVPEPEGGRRAFVRAATGEAEGCWTCQAGRTRSCQAAISRVPPLPGGGGGRVPPARLRRWETELLAYARLMRDGETRPGLH